MNVPCARVSARLVPILVLASCASPLADYSGYVAPRPYAVECGEAWQYAATALKGNGFKIAEVRREARGGTVIGRRDSEEMRIGLSCESDGVHVTPSGLTPYAQNGLLIAFERVMQTARAERPPPSGMEVEVELIAGPESPLYFSSSLDGSSTTAARFRVANGGARPVKLVAANVRLRAASGALAAPVDGDEIRRRLPALAAEIVPRLLPSGTLESGQRAEGFLLFPENRYEGAMIPLVDVATGESDEFDVGFP
jgi:hypothetical protein